MNKKLVALAVSAVAAGAASAQTANVTLYGVLDTYLASERVSAQGTTPSVSVTVLNAGGLSGSRWGLRGSESLGGGMNAIFNLENGFDSSTGGLNQGGRLFGRRAFVGLNGGFGQVQVGRDYSPNFWVQALRCGTAAAAVPLFKRRVTCRTGAPMSSRQPRNSSRTW